MAVVSEALQKIVVERIWTIKDFLESERSRLTSGNAEQRLEALKDLVSVIKKLPDQALSEKEIVLLLDYFSSTILSFAASCSVCIDAVYHLIMHLNLFPFGQEMHLYNSFFVENLICDCVQSDRLKLLKILYHLLLNDLKAYLPYNDEVVRSFIRGTQGEVNPECLMVVFKLFCFISNNFRLGLFVDDFFEVVACYYPIVFEPLNEDRETVTKLMLVNACEQCLLCNKNFGPFTFQLVVEKLLDDDIKEVQKIEICSFMCKVCETFDVSVLLDQLDDVLGALRMVAFDLKSRNGELPLPKPVLRAAKTIIQKLLKNSNDNGCSIIRLCDNLIESCEPFVLEADLGFTSRALQLCEVFYRSTASVTQKLLEAVFKWLIKLNEGRTIHTIADNDEVICTSTKWLVEWCEIAVEFGNESLAISYYGHCLNQLVSNPRISKAIHYKLAEILLPVISDNDAFKEFCQRLLNDSFTDILNSSLRPMCILFVKKFARTKWEDFYSLFLNLIATPENKLSLALISGYAVNGHESATFAFSHINDVLDIDVFAANHSLLFNCILDIFVANKRNESLCMEFFKKLIASFSAVYGKIDIPIEYAALFQDIGLALSPDNHAVGLNLCLESLTHCKELIQLYYLIILQSSNTKYLEAVCEVLGNNERFNKYKSLIAGCVVNRECYGDSEESLKVIGKTVKRLTGQNHQYCGFICKMLLLSNSGLGVRYLRELFDSLKNEDRSAEHIQELISVLNFEDKEFDPEKCMYNCTKLWRQRIICQFVTVYLQYYNAAETNEALISKLIQLLWPLLAFAEPVAEFVVMELKQLIVLVNEYLEKRLNNGSEGAILKAFYYFLKLDSKAMQLELPLNAMLFLKDSIRDGETMEVRLYAIKCLRLLMKYFSEVDLLKYRSDVTYSLVSATGSKKRVIRSAAAEARNAWECYLGMQSHKGQIQ